MSTHNIYFRGEIRKILCGYPLLSVAMTACMRRLIWALVFYIYRVREDNFSQTATNAFLIKSDKHAYVCKLYII